MFFQKIKQRDQLSENTFGVKEHFLNPYPQGRGQLRQLPLLSSRVGAHVRHFHCPNALSERAGSCPTMLRPYISKEKRFGVTSMPLQLNVCSTFWNVVLAETTFTHLNSIRSDGFNSGWFTNGICWQLSHQ